MKTEDIKPTISDEDAYKRSDFGFPCPLKKSDPVAHYIKRFAEVQKQSRGGLQTFA